jgi:Ras homolog gene family, member A
MGAHYMECSSKEMQGVEEIFDMAVTMAVGDEYKPVSSRNGGSSTTPIPGTNKKKTKKSKCTFL